MNLKKMLVLVGVVLMGAWQVCTASYVSGITFSGYQGSTTLTDFPALIELPGGIPGFGYSQCATNSNGVVDGSDIYFQDSSGNVLASEIDTWDSSGVSYLWVRVPSLAKTTKITMCWGDAEKATAAKATATVTKVWNDNYMTVHHFSALDASEASGTMRGRFYDSAQQTWNNAAIEDTDQTGAYTSCESAKVGNGYHAQGTGSVGSKLTFTAVDDNTGWKQYTANGNLTVSFWMQADSMTGDMRLVCCKNNWKDASGFEIATRAAEGMQWCIGGTGDGTTSTVQYKPTTTVVNTSLTYATIVYSGGKVTLYLNGSDWKGTSGTSDYYKLTPTPMSVLTFCGRPGSNDNHFGGILDEVRTQKIAVSADWQQADYDTMNTPTTFAVATQAAQGGTAHWLGTVDGDPTNPANWLYTNAVGEVVAQIPDASTAVFVDGETCNLNVPAGTALAYQSLTLADTVTLAGDCDWSGLDDGAGLAFLTGKTVDVNGHSLTLQATADLTVGTVTNSAATIGVCQIQVPTGNTIVNSGLALLGNLQFAKAGEGTFQAAKTGQSYTGSTVVQAGTASTGNSPKGLWTDRLYGVPGGSRSITVMKGATFETGGKMNYRAYQFILDGGTLSNSGADMGTYADAGGIGCIKLTDDSSFVIAKKTVQNADAYSPGNENGLAVIDLNGHKLTVRLSTGVYWLPRNLIVRDGQLSVVGSDGKVGGGYLQVASGYSFDAADNVDLDLACNLEFKNDAMVSNLTCRSTYARWSATNRVVTVKGTFKPMTQHFCNLAMGGGTTLDLSGLTSAFATKNVETASDGTTATFYTTFAEEATIYIEAGTRTFRSGARIIAWETAPTGVKFVNSASGRYHFEVKEDGVYAYNGGSVLILR